MTEYRRWRWNSSIPKPLKDYAVPLLALFLILIIIYSVFSGNNDKTKNNINSSKSDIQKQVDWLVIWFNWDNTKASDEYPSGDKKELEDNSVVYKWEKIIVKQWSVSTNLTWKAELNLDKLWILKYKEDGSLYLESSNLWVKAINDINIWMKFANVSIKKWSVVNLNQNDVESTVYVLTWMAEVSNLAWASTIVWKWQKVWVLVQDAWNKDVDLSNIKTDIDDYFKLSDWFIQNSWDYYLNSNKNNIDSASWTLSNTWWVVNSNNINNWNINNYVSFDNISDWAYVSSDSIDIRWKILSDNIWKITIWEDYVAKINFDKKTFIIPWVSIDKKTNDLVFKLYDTTWELVSKFVYTIYNSKWLSNDKKTWFKVTNYKIDASKFVFTSPSTTWTYSTYDNFVTIRWSVPMWVVWKIEVDWYNLKSFNWITWRYHASTDYNNLKVWTNQYEIKYFDKHGKLIFKNYYTIILKSKKMWEKIISNEAKN